MSNSFETPQPNNEIDMGVIADQQAKMHGINMEDVKNVPPPAAEKEIDIGEIARRQQPGFEGVNTPAPETARPSSWEGGEAMAKDLKAQGQTAMREALGELETPANVKDQAAKQLEDLETNGPVN